MRASDLGVGKARPIEVLSEKFTLYRGNTGGAHLVAFRCPHRGTQLSIGWVEGDDIRCRYHGWKFSPQGMCIEQPDEDRPFNDRVKLARYPVQEYLGLIFVYLGEGAVPVFPRYPDMDKQGVIVTDPIEIVPCNYWNRLDNDIGHIPWVHRATALRKGRLDFITPRRESVKETSYGWISKRTLKGEVVSGLLDMSATAHFFMPNVYQFGVRTRTKGFEDRNLWDTKITWTVPLNDSAFAAFDVTLTPLVGEDARNYNQNRKIGFEAEVDNRWEIAESILKGDMTIEEIPDDLSAYTSFAIEDYVTQVGQGAIAGRGKEQLGGLDVKVVLTRRLWIEEVKKLLAGESLSNWIIRDEALQKIVEG